MIRLRTFVGMLVLGVLGVVLAAPVPKEKEENPGPVTDKQLKQSQKNLKQILLAMHHYESAEGHFPNNDNLKWEKGKPAVSWRVHILPYLEEETLYKQIMKEYKSDEAWDSENNKKFIEKMPKIYAPIRVKTKEAGHTFYRGFTGTSTAFESGKKIRIMDLIDGSSNTVMVVEAGESVPWTKPDDLPFDAKKDLPKLGGLFDGVFHAAYADGSVHRSKAKFDAETLKAMITRNGGEVIMHSNVFEK